jgi:hypothetical protein
MSTRDGSMEGQPCRFGKYTLIRKLAAGGMAELFLAIRKSVAGFEKLVVIKRILSAMNQDRAFIDMLLHEARVAATLSHPNIVHVFDVGSVDGTYFIAMEHVHGEDLRSIVRQMKKKDETEFPLEHALAAPVRREAGGAEGGPAPGQAARRHHRARAGRRFGLGPRRVEPEPERQRGGDRDAHGDRWQGREKGPAVGTRRRGDWDPRRRGDATDGSARRCPRARHGRDLAIDRGARPVGDRDDERSRSLSPPPLRAPRRPLRTRPRRRWRRTQRHAAPAGARPTPTPAPATVGTRKLNVSAHGGWCNVSVDGTPRGPTPVAGIVLPAEPHTVTCTPESGWSAGVRIDADGTTWYAFTLP